MKRSARAICLSIFAATLATTAAAAVPRSYIEHAVPPGAKSLPFSDAVVSGDTLYVAGHLGIDPKTGNAVADPAAEAVQVLEAVKHTVESAGFGMDDFVSVTVYCTDLNLYETFNGAYQKYFHGHYPARAFIGADKLVRGAHFEIQGVAIRSAKP